MRQACRCVRAGQVIRSTSLPIRQRPHRRMPRQHWRMLRAETIAVARLATIRQVSGVAVNARIVVHRRLGHHHVGVARRRVVGRHHLFGGHPDYRHPRCRMRIRRAVGQQDQAEQGAQQGSEAGHAPIIRQARGRTVP